MACDPALIVVPPACEDRQHDPPIPRTCPVRDGAACAMGDGSACPNPPFPELDCREELPCDQDLPLVEMTTIIPDIQTVDISWLGVDAADEIEFLITGIFEDYNVEPLTPFYELNDYERRADEASGVVGTTTMGVIVQDRVYSVHARRVRDGKVSMWSTERTVGIAGSHTYLIDGNDIIVDDYLGEVVARVAPTPIIDDEVP
jgi:hypothetical protein